MGEGERGNKEGRGREGTYRKFQDPPLNKTTFAFHKVVRRHYSGEVGEFIIF